MVPSPALTWSTLATQYAAAYWPPLAPLARTYYAQQGRLVTAVNYLNLPPAAAAEPFIGNVSASQLVSAALPGAGPVDETYAEYVLRGTDYAQPLLIQLTNVLQEQAITLADFVQQAATPEGVSYLTTLLGSSFWIPVTAAWQQQVQQQLDRDGRWQRLLTTQDDPVLQALLVNLGSRLAISYPMSSINSVSELPLNELARALWIPAPAVDEPLLIQLVGNLQAAAQLVVTQNYPDAELPTRLLANVSSGVALLAQLLLLDPEGKPAITTVAELATAELATIARRIVLLPANHPLVYALAAWVRDTLQEFLLVENPANPISFSLLPVRGQLLGAEDKLLANFSVLITQTVGSQEGVERSLGELRTDAEGRFALNVRRDLYLDDNDAVVEAPIKLRAAVYYPNQKTADEPALTLALTAGDAEVTYQTDLPLVALLPTSQAINKLSLSTALNELLTEHGIDSLVDVRAAGGVQHLIANADDLELLAAARRLDSLAQFEVVSSDTAFHERVVDEGFSSPIQLLQSVSQADFMARLVGDAGSDELRTQATAFYQQVAAVQALSEALGLLTGNPATYAETAASPRVAARFANLGDLADQGAIDGDSATMAFGPSNINNPNDPSAPTLPGYVLADGMNAAPVGPKLGYQPDGQCDCPACRSAVSPTAYLAALLKYATQYLRYNGRNSEPSDLQGVFLQPYCDLAVTCQAADEQVCQYRLAIEVLQAYWRTGASPNAGGPLTLADARPYVEGVLDALLQALGTSLTELRATTDDTRATLAGRLRLPTDLISSLQTRFAASQLTDARSLDELEADLEELFGLASTAVDPLCTGLLLTPAAPNAAITLVRWSLQGVEYGINTDADGQLSILVTPGTEPHVTVYAGQATEDNVVARGTLLESNSLTHTYTGLLYPQHGSGLRGSVMATVSGSAEATFKLAVVPAVTAGRQQVLAAEWLSQDANAIALLQAHGQTPSWNGFTYLVDPDLLGPDDFRRLNPAQANFGNRAYQLWRRRYEFLQNQLVTGLLPSSNPYEAIADVGGLGKLLDALATNSLTYHSDNLQYVRTLETQALTNYAAAIPGALATGTDILVRLHADYASNTAVAALAIQALRSLGLSVEALVRLYDLWQFNRTQKLNSADLQEALDIVRQSVKKRFEDDWATEEQSSSAPVNLDTQLFQSALHEPQVGIWQQVRPLEFGFTQASQMPRIDPDEVTPLDLPDAGLGDQANQFWSDRQAELLQKRQAILASGTSETVPTLRANAMLTYAYRANRFAAAPLAVLPGTPPSGLTTFENVVAVAQNGTDAQNIQALAYLAATLNLRLTEAARLVELRAQVAAQPADTLWQEMAALLTLAWKRAVAYRVSYVAEGISAPATGVPAVTQPSWLTQEVSVSAFQSTPLDYFIGTRKHRLVKWRADAATRIQWVQALTLAGQRPLIDPDQLVPGDFRQAGERSRSNYVPALAAADKPYLNPAFELYQRRTGEVEAKYAALQADWTAAQLLTNRKAASWQLIAAATYSTQAELETLYNQQEAGANVSPVLRRLQLTPDSLTLLVTQANRLAPERPDEVAHLLTQLYRQRRYAAWAREEIALRIVPTPYYFRQPQAEAESLAALPWRSSAVARRQWQRTLDARFEQAASLTVAQQQAVKAAEDQYLLLLRDALLVAKVGNPSDSFTTRATLLEDKYLIDFQTVCCQHTTRVAQASMVLQKLFTNVRGGMSSNYFTLDLNDKTFESDWQWLSSFERWRSLMFLYLYPQNVLLPSLKPGQTSQFQQTVRAIRAAASTSPADARRYMDAYQAYLVDMDTLVIATATETSCDGESTDGFTASTGRQPISVQVALAASHIAYSNIFNITGSPAENSFVWNRLPGTALVERVVGSAAYQPQSGQRYVYVFALLREEQKNALAKASLYLAFQRLNLTSLTWDEDYTRLDINDAATLDTSSVQVVSGGDETWAPVLVGLRNRRVLLYTDPPFSQAAVAGDTDQELYRVLAENDNHYNVDLFFALLDSAGTGIGLEQARTIFLCVSAQLLAGIRMKRDRLMLCTALSIGSFTKPIKLTIFEVKIADYGNQVRYLIPKEFSTTDALTVTRTGGNSTANYSWETSLFSSASHNTYFQPVIENISRVLRDGELSLDPKFLIESIGRSIALPGQPTVWQPVLAQRRAVLIAAGGRVTAMQVSSTPGALDDFTLTVYYNTYTQIPATPTGIATHELTFTYTNGGYYKNGTADVISDLALSYIYQGPVVRSGYADAGTPTPTVKVSETNNSRYPLQRGGALSITTAGSSNTYSLHGVLGDLPPLFSFLRIDKLNERRAKIATNVGSNPSFTNTLTSEAYYALPILLAQELTRSRNYELALHYYRLVYDYTRLPNGTLASDERIVYPALISSNGSTYSEPTVMAWLINPNNPYTLAGLRSNAHLDYVVMSVVRCLLAYADTEFTADTSESVDRARSLYELAARLLKQDITQYATPGTSELLDPLDALFPATWLAEWQSLKAMLARVNQRAVLEQVLNRATIAGTSGGLTQLFTNAQAGSLTWADAFEQAWEVVNGQLDALTGGYLSLCAAANSSPATTIAPLPFTLPTVSVRPYVPFRSANFCVPTNPVPFALALQAELNLFKIRSCRNIAGVQRELDPYAAATDTITGLPTLSSTGQLMRSTRLVVPATPYRYAYIMERARNLVALAQQTEASLLAALEKRDAEAYNQFKARQDIAVSQATVQLQSLRVTEAEDGVDLAGLQLERSEIMETQYDEWLNAGLNTWENAQMNAIVLAGELKAIAALAAGADLLSNLKTLGGNAAAAVINAGAAIADTAAQINGLKATYARRGQEWRFQRNLAAQDIKINQQQIKIANDQVKVRGQEKRISQLQLDHASAVLNFLTTKFTNAELYDWMSGILQGAYSYFLQQATATARLAEQQLAFERQQVPGGIVQADYYSDPVEDATYDYSGSNGSTSDRRGLTGSVRLLQDLTRLDEYAFETTKRKLQLSKTISLAQSFPTEFVRFRDTGVVSFACQPEWFDQDFPGHYLRVLRRVRTSVVALVPTVDGIKARLSTAGTSHVTVDGAPFQTLTLPRGQEVVALTSPSNATGLFELDQQSSELLLPFEGLGVDVPWQFSMQPASNPNLDYSAVADVLITLDYSALESADYARQVVQQLGAERQQQVVLSMRDRFADQWYDLHHAGEVDPAQQYMSTLTLTADDLPRNLRGVSVTQVSLYVDAPLDDELSDPKAFADRSHLELSLTRGTRGGAAFTNQYGLISTRTGTGSGPLYTGNAGALVPLIGTTPAGDWTLTIGPGRLRDRLAAGLVNDIYLILEVEGDMPAYVL
jgi:hypothetical protein